MKTGQRRKVPARFIIVFTQYMGGWAQGCARDAKGAHGGAPAGVALTLRRTRFTGYGLSGGRIPSGWQAGQKCVPRPPTTLFSIRVPQVEQGSFLRP